VLAEVPDVFVLVLLFHFLSVFICERDHGPYRCMYSLGTGGKLNDYCTVGPRG
jgi:hypothetical protein